jgi:DNA-binding transcriptional ArsR family regulator
MVSEQVREHEQSLFTALADPIRRSLLVNLAEHSPRTATQLAEEYPITRQGILKHLTILEDAGLVAVHQAGREKRYTLTPEPLEELGQWIEDIGAKWDERLLRLKTWLEGEQSE